MPGKRLRRSAARIQSNAVPVHWGTWWPMGLPQRPDLIDLPAVAFADRVARIAPSTRVHILRHGQSVKL